MRDGARRLAAQAAGRASPPDVLLASDYLDVPGFYGFLPGAWSRVPLVLYFHENQLTYPRAPGLPEPDPERDRHFAYTHVLSCLRASAVVFNSDFHRREFDRAARTFLKRLPNDAPRGAFAERMERSEVIGPGVALEELPLGSGPEPGEPLAIAFPHRWEHDKDPVAFLEALERLAERGVDYRLHLFGERYRELPPGVGERLEALTPKIASDGFRPAFEDYARDLGRADVVVSTARHEFYGIAVLEALAVGCAPLLPARLSYPELLADRAKIGAEVGLYRTADELVSGLERLASNRDELRRPAARAGWRALAEPRGAQRAARRLDQLCGKLA